MAQYSEFAMCIVHPKLLHTLGICPPFVTPDNLFPEYLRSVSVTVSTHCVITICSLTDFFYEIVFWVEVMA